MKSLTLHAIDDQLAALIKKRADESSLSMNALAKRILAQALGIEAKPTGRHRREFESFCGGWGKADLADFNKRTREFEAVNPGDWK